MTPGDFIALGSLFLLAMSGIFGMMKYVVRSELAPLRQKVDDHVREDRQWFRTLFNNLGLPWYPNGDK